MARWALDNSILRVDDAVKVAITNYSFDGEVIVTWNRYRLPVSVSDQQQFFADRLVEKFRNNGIKTLYCDVDYLRPPQRNRKPVVILTARLSLVNAPNLLAIASMPSRVMPQWRVSLPKARELRAVHPNEFYIQDMPPNASPDMTRLKFRPIQDTNSLRSLASYQAGTSQDGRRITADVYTEKRNMPWGQDAYYVGCVNPLQPFWGVGCNPWAVGGDKRLPLFFTAAYLQSIIPEFRNMPIDTSSKSPNPKEKLFDLVGGQLPLSGDPKPFLLGPLSANQVNDAHKTIIEAAKAGFVPRTPTKPAKTSQECDRPAFIPPNTPWPKRQHA